MLMITLRPINDSDVPVIKAWPPYPSEFAELDYSLRDGGWLDKYRTKPGAEILAAVYGTEIVGFSILASDGNGIFEFRIALHPQRIGGGLGKKVLFLTLMRGFTFHGAERVRLIVRKNNLRAQALYTLYNFNRTGECIEQIQGEPVEFFTMEITREGFSKVNTMKQALLVIDVQNEYFTGKLPVTYPEGSFENILKAMDRAHASHVPIVVIQHTNLTPDATTFRKGTPAWELHDEVKRRHFDIVIEKNLPGSFTGTTLERWLKDHGIVVITIAGYMTQMCCDTTARQAFHLGYTVNFLSDATGTLSITNTAGSITAADLHHAILITQQMRFSTVVKTDEWIGRI
jgi:nicotinamidase-related amidase/ribosomal protein S18 acetylase RimI-like enzyme